MDYELLFQNYYEKSLFGRYITLQHIEPLLKNRTTKVLGYSVNKLPIYQITYGNGPIKVLMWSQMHGNESTTTKSVFDFLNLLDSESDFSKKLCEKFTFSILPMVNPDGAQLYTRENAKGVDLNRDASELSQPESKLLRQAFDNFKPDYCYNLHDQRTLFGAGKSGMPATVSFLAPAFNEQREYNATRRKAVKVINAMNRVLQQIIPNQVGRFDDTFNINCTGDTFQFLGVPTLLFEAGHFPDDYQREITRKLIFIALISGLWTGYENDIVDNDLTNYLNIPQNEVVFFDFLYKNVKINYDNLEKNINFAAQYKEVLVDAEIIFEAVIAKTEDLDNFYGHQVFDAQGKYFQSQYGQIPIIGEKADFYFGNDIIFVNGLKI